MTGTTDSPDIFDTERAIRALTCKRCARGEESGMVRGTPFHAQGECTYNPKLLTLFQAATERATLQEHDAQDAIAGAYEAAAKHRPIVKPGHSNVICLHCAEPFNSTEAWADHIRALTPADARQAQDSVRSEAILGLFCPQHRMVAGQAAVEGYLWDECPTCEIASAEARGRLELSFAELRAANLSRCSRWHPRGLNEWSLSDWGIATAGEMGEALNIIKKLNRERDGIAGNSLTADQLRGELADELADVAIYLDILAASEGIDLAAAIVSKFNRTSKKVGFPERLAAARSLTPDAPPHDNGGK